MTQMTLIIAGIIVLLVILTIIGLLSRYRKCPSDQLLVVYGKVGGSKGASKIYPGGGVFVWPVIQDYKVMSMRPFQINSEVVGPDLGMIKTHVTVALTTAISQDPIIQQNAATRFLSASLKEVQEQIKTILEGEVRLIVASMSIEEINSDRDAFKTKVKESLGIELNKVGYDITNINIQEISDESSYIKNLGRKKETEARANAEADIAEKEKEAAIRKAKIKQEEETQVAIADRDRETTVSKTKQEQAVKVAEINREQEIKLAQAEKEQESGIAEQQAEQIANVAAAQAKADQAKARSEAEAAAGVARSMAEAESLKQEAESQKQIRIANAKQAQEAETTKAIQEKEAKQAEYESEKKKRKAEADKQAGVAEQEAKIAVAEATAKAGKAQADQVKQVETAKVEAELSVARTREERQLEVNEARAKANEAELRAKEIIPAQKAKEKAIIEAEAEKQKKILEAEARAAEILKKAEAEANQIRMTKEAEAEGTKKILMAEAEGKKASLMAEAEKEIAIGMIPAQVVQAMRDAGMTPEMIVQYKTVDRLEGIAKAQAEAYEHIHLGEVTVYGNENTAGNFMSHVAESVMPMIKTAEPIKNAVANLFKKTIQGDSEQVALVGTQEPNDPEPAPEAGDFEGVK